SEPIAQTLRGIDGVVCADDLSGPFDAIALAGSGSTGQLMEGIVAKIRELPGVLRVLPAPLIRSLTGSVPRRADDAA
ncbi:MAG: Lrp/AsnC ligand binding domain-containing protein, partial [Actinomycetota bacterium]|nr:Lrp/AsnC ligand binding domain-containing protein [Actinomycetota bacterium]